MLPDYSDIIDAASGQKPLWYDGNGTPRFAPFAPNMVGVYCREAILYLIRCQSCRRRFAVAEGRNWYEACEHDVNHLNSMTADTVRELHYGDPPRHDCTGDTMNCDDIRILEFWRRGALAEWVRVPDLEIALADAD